MKKILIAAVLAAMAGTAAAGVSGRWTGKLSVGLTKLPLVLNFGEQGCTMDSPAQGVTGMPMEVEACTDDSVAIACRSIDMRYRAKVKDGVMRGKFTQRGITFPLEMRPDAPDTERRPQTPRPPYPYATADTVFASADGTRLGGTMALPEGARTMVVFVTGSGPQNRDEELFDHKPFAVIADKLARCGVASLRYDDRGTGQSEGDFASSTTYTFRDDARAAIEACRGIPGIERVGVVGHSEGGTIAFMLAADGSADFVVSLAGMAVPAKEMLLRQNELSLDKYNIRDEARAQSLALISRVFDLIAAGQPVDMDSLMADGQYGSVPQIVVESIKKNGTARSAWFDGFVALDPTQWLASVRCPLLAINGTKDLQVNAESNLAHIAQLVPHAKIMSVAGLNHLMQHARTGELDEYGTIRETVAPEVLDAIADFCRRPSERGVE